MVSKKNKRKSSDLAPEGDEEAEAEKLLIEALAKLDALTPEEVEQLAGKREDQEFPKSYKRKAKVRREAIELDLHGFTVDEATAEVEREIDRLLSEAPEIYLKIITGRGRHSGEAGGVLHDAIYKFVQTRFVRQIEKIDAPPSATVIQGMPMRGWFHVWLRRR